MVYALEVHDLKKSFGSVKANDGISLNLKAGSIHAIVGENGAGKSTMVNQISGLFQPDEGHIKIFGKEIVLNSPQDAYDKGIGVVHQHFKLIDAFTAIENIVIGAEPNTYSVLDKKQARKQVDKICQKYSIDINLDAQLHDLPVGVQQRIEIVKVLYRGAKILFLDEPTAVLTPQEIDSLFSILRDLKSDGVSIVFISHKMKEVMEIADAVTVIRDGKTINSWSIDEVNEKKLANSMVGREVKTIVNKREKNSEKKKSKFLEVENLTIPGSKFQVGTENITFHINKGEIYGFVGVSGNGQEALIEGILGLKESTEGSIKLGGKDITNNIPINFRENNIGFISSDRLKEGLIKEFSVRDNSYLGYQENPKLLKGPFFSDKKITQWAKEMVKQNNVKVSSILDPITSLSGGNQQKLIIGREIQQNPDLLIAVQPTRGVDIGAIQSIYETLLELRDQNISILLISQELEEVLALADRIGIIYDGKLVGQGSAEEFSQEEIGLMMAGTTLKEVKNN